MDYPVLGHRSILYPYRSVGITHTLATLAEVNLVHQSGAPAFTGNYRVGMRAREDLPTRHNSSQTGIRQPHPQGLPTSSLVTSLEPPLPRGYKYLESPSDTFPWTPVPRTCVLSTTKPQQQTRAHR